VRALFVTNQLKTEFYSPWARAMEAAGAEIFWVSTGERWTSYLMGQGWDRSRILDLSGLGSRWTTPFKPTTEQQSRIQRIDRGAEIGLKNALIMDRELALNPGWDIEAYGQVTALEIERFVLDNDIRFAFGEDTWAPEIITSAVMHANGRHFHAPHTIRIPSERFAFFPGVFQKRIDVFCEQPEEEHRAIARQALKNLRERGERPYYFALNMNQNRMRKHWLDESRRAIMRPADARFDHTMPSLRTRVGRRVASVLSGALAKRPGTFETPPETAERPFALFLLQKQPESSVDVIGAPFTDQYEIIQALTRLLPFDWEMWVKEHPNAIGDRTLAYYRDLRRLPGVRLIDPFADTHRLISRAGLTISISGTACLEAGLLGKPAITIAEMYFDRVLLRNGFNPFQASHGDFAGIVDEAVTMMGSLATGGIEDYLAWNVAQSFPGIISDPANVSSVTNQENVSNVADATMKFLQRLSQ
jgi:hypothetical protein